MKRSLRLIAAGVLAASAIGLSLPAQAQSAFSFGFSDRGSHFSMGVNEPRYRPYYDDYGPRYYPRPSYYDYRPYPYRPHYRDHRVQVYDPYLGRYVWVWR